MILGKMLINGEWSAGSTGQTFSVINPATEEIIAKVPKAAATDVEQVVAAAARAFPAWSQLSPAQRGTFLRRASVSIMDRRRFALCQLNGGNSDSKLLQQLRQQIRIFHAGS